MKTLVMPSFGADMAKGMVAKWLVKPGDEVKQGDIIASIETMKGLIDMEVFDDGVIDSLLVDEGLDVTVGDAIALMRVAAESSSAGSAAEEPPAKLDRSEQLTPPDIVPPPKKPVAEQSVDIIDRPLAMPNTALKISPAARVKAHQLGINWQQLGPGRGPDGAIVLADIDALSGTDAKMAAATASVASRVAAPLDTPAEASLQMRQAIASVVSLSKQQIPHYYLELDICLDAAKLWLSTHNASLAADKRILSNALMFCAIARALTKFAEFNGFYQQGNFEPAKQVHLGNAISLRQGGLVVAAIHDAHLLNPQSMMVKLKDQVMRAREGGLRMSEMQDATITVSNLGDRGCDRMQSIIFPPQVAIIAIGKERIVPWVRDDKITIASVVSVSLAADHRVSDGHMGARLLNKINSLLQQPESLWPASPNN
jgi:pyruvate dehydrogenase E2 component (dihydrolipoamide acetyltransferase)